MVDDWSAYQRAFLSGELDDLYGWYVAYADGTLVERAQTKTMLRERMRTRPEEQVMIIKVGQKHPSALETIRTLERARFTASFRRFLIACGYLFIVALVFVKIPIIAFLTALFGPYVAHFLADPRSEFVKRYEKQQLLVQDPIRNYWAVQALETTEISRTLSEMRLQRSIDRIKR